MAAVSIAKIAVADAVYAIDKPYDYRIPESLQEKVTPGSRVLVAFGRGNRKSEGIVLAVSNASEIDASKLKCIESVLDETQVLSDELLHLALWMRERCFCTVYNAVRTILPTGLWFHEGVRNVGDKEANVARLAIPVEEALILADQKQIRAPRQAAVLKFLVSSGETSVKEIAYYTGTTASTVRSMAASGLLTVSKVEVLRRPKVLKDQTFSPFVLTPEQLSVFNELNAQRSKGTSCALLVGVTGSGKTAVYISLIQQVLAEGKSAIVLVPEIGLTPQFLSLFSFYFGDLVAVLHSSLSLGEHYDEWKRINRGDARVVIGTRSAVFAPVSDLGIIIVDEEQESTYKSENVPRYHARDIAKYRCAKADCMLLLGSATPSIESYYYAQTGKYSLFKLNSRFNKRSLPEVKIADMRQEILFGNSGFIGSALKEEIAANLINGEQSILFINRRGTANLVVCGACGFTFFCPNCSVAMTYHSANRRLMCHYCGHSQPINDVCPSCSGQMKFLGSGTQKIEEEIKTIFPDVPVIRMDTDTVNPMNAHEQILERFKKERIPILIGTQMVSKGLNLENVTLVGVINADQALYANDFRAHERTFSMLTQVIGRSGRGERVGRAVIQSFTPENEVIRLSAEQNFYAFYEREIQIRTLLDTPPVCDLLEIGISGIDEEQVLRSGVIIRDSLISYLSDLGKYRVLGPVPAVVSKVSNRFRYSISVFGADTRKLRDVVAHVIRSFSSDRQNRGVAIFADINPQS